MNGTLAIQSFYLTKKLHLINKNWYICQIAMTSIGNFVPVELFIVDRHFGFCRSPDFSGPDLASHFAGKRTGNGLN